MSKKPVADTIKKGIGIPSTRYTRDYYTTSCDGYDEFTTTHGRVLPPRLEMPLQLVTIQPGMRIVDIGCGRGELLMHCARRGAQVWGLDYAEEALALCRELLASPSNADIRDHIILTRASALELPLPAQSVDIVFMLDVVEHLYPAELQQAFLDIRRVLKPGGKLIIHTMPNLWYYDFGYPLYRGLQRLRGQQLPADPRARWDYHDVHVNEQTPHSLRRALRKSKLRSYVWLKTTQPYTYEQNALIRWGMTCVTNIYPFRWIFCNDIFAVATKP